ncbi:hypothetical protein PIROE2DRAFT_7954 [Piromyces sp. E2]|nr:hypothetical protein PIROE2DRAFT_7954 [Piromyces sp. E2]|eukprot:OUM65066.1 hypothetical protein PIROE2DRAFT_7954 [Piromyces sp. E2]
MYNLKKLLKRVNKWAIENNMTFGINKCATIVVRPNTPKEQGRRDPTFYFGNKEIPKTNCLSRNKIEWKNLCKYQLKYGSSSDIPFLAKTAAFFNIKMPIVSGQRCSVINRYSSKVNKNANNDNTVRRASSANDHISVYAHDTERNRKKNKTFHERITPDCLNYCPCCGHGEQTFLHWILLCSALIQYRTTSLVFNELQIDKTEQRHLNEQLYSSSRFHVPHKNSKKLLLLIGAPDYVRVKHLT